MNGENLQKGKRVGLGNQKNDENDHTTCSFSKCKEYSKEKGVIKTSNLETLRKTHSLHHFLVRKKLQHLMSLTKTEARKACESLSLLEGSSADMMENTCCTLLNN